METGGKKAYFYSIVAIDEEMKEPVADKRKIISQVVHTPSEISSQMDTFVATKNQQSGREKEYTYDLSEVDWMEFAKMQVEFFTYAHQYEANLDIAIEEIDGEIEDTLRFIENANCNVAQGYKYFKKLKELRNARKDKIKEYQCVRALSDGYDCEYMKEAYEYSLGLIEDIMVEEQE